MAPSEPMAVFIILVVMVLSWPVWLILAVEGYQHPGFAFEIVGVIVGVLIAVPFLWLYCINRRQRVLSNEDPAASRRTDRQQALW